ncbi:MAG: hypothetical protein ACOC4C_01520 [Fibrobacterota bacterium]
MTRRTIALLRLLILPAVVLLAGSCGILSTSGGSGTEIVGKVEFQDDSSSSKMVAGYRSFLPAFDIPVYLYPRNLDIDLNNLSIPRVRTHSDGSFRFSNIPGGEYFVEANDGEGKTARREVDASGEEETIDVGVLVLSRGSSILDSLFEWWYHVNLNRAEPESQGSKK